MMHMHHAHKIMAEDDHPADVNNDNIVDVSDLLIMFKKFGSTCKEHEEAGWFGLQTGGDWNGASLFGKPDGL